MSTWMRATNSGYGNLTSCAIQLTTFLNILKGMKTMSRTHKYSPTLATVFVALMGIAVGTDATRASEKTKDDNDEKPVYVKLFAPADGDRAGIGGRGWFVDLALQFSTSLDNTGFSAFQLTGPAGHNNIAPFPGTFAAGADERLPGLIVLLSTTTVGAGSCQNVANLFNMTGVTDVTPDAVELWDTWLVGAPNFGVNTSSSIFVAVADDLNQDGVYNDAPDVVSDVDGDGVCSVKDLKALGLASNVAKARFFVNP